MRRNLPVVAAMALVAALGAFAVVNADHAYHPAVARAVGYALVAEAAVGVVLAAKYGRRR